MRRAGGLHTLYISPLKALAVDIARNLEAPVAEMGLPIRIETRTGDTPTSKRQRQRRDPPDILLTTPEQLALLLASADAPYLFGSLKRVILDELHALVTSKRGDLLALDLARLFRVAPELTSIGLSATVAEPNDLCRFMVPQRDGAARADLILAEGGAAPDVSMLDSDERLPWAGHSARYALGELYALIKSHRTTLVFVNTRSQAEGIFQDLWHLNEDNLAIALHHGSLDVAQRRKVEGAMTSGRLRAVVCTSSLDLGVDWGDVDLVVNVGAPKGASRLLQRIGRANHRMDEPSKGVLIPANRFEVLECRAALDAIAVNAQDTPALRTGALDVLAQHVLGCACGEPFLSDDLYAEVTLAAPYTTLSRARISTPWSISSPPAAMRSRPMSASPGSGRARTAAGASPIPMWRSATGSMSAPSSKPTCSKCGWSARALRGSFRAAAGSWARSRSISSRPWCRATPSCSPVKSSNMRRSSKTRSMCRARRRRIPRCRPMKAANFRSRPISPIACAASSPIRAPGAPCRRKCCEWLEIQQWRSQMPGRRELLVETFPRANKHYLVCYPFEGRLAHQTLGMLLTRRLERARLSRWVLSPTNMRWRSGASAISRRALPAANSRSPRLFDEDMLGDDLEAWLAESALMKRTFRTCAIIAGLIERRFPGQEKSRRQVTISTDLVYDVLRSHQPDHVLLRAARADAATGLLDVRRLGEMLSRIKGRIVHKALDHVSPLAVPVMLEIGREAVYGEAADTLLAETEAELVKEAMQ